MLSPSSIRIPKSWEIIAGADTGTYMGGCIAAIDPNLELYVLGIYPNYKYTGDGTIELIGMTVGEWIKGFATDLKRWTGERKVSAWVDANTTFKTEIAHGLRFRMNKRHLELRTEITREYLRNGRIHLMPWVVEQGILTYEMEEASWPEAESVGSGRMVRLKKKDHCLDGLEHICSRRPKNDADETGTAKPSIKDQIIAKSRKYQGKQDPIDDHMGSL